MSFSLRLLLAIIATVAAVYSIQAIDNIALSVQAISIIFACLTLTSFISPVIVPSLQQGDADNTAKPARKKRKSKKGKREGTVKWFNLKKGYGFITDNDGEDIFVHYRSINQGGDKRRGLRDGEAVSFVLSHGDKGPQAEDVDVL